MTPNRSSSSVQLQANVHPPTRPHINLLFVPDRLNPGHPQIFKVLANKPVYVTGKFSSNSGAKAVKCALGANEGHLYPLNKVTNNECRILDSWSKLGCHLYLPRKAYSPFSSKSVHLLHPCFRSQSFIFIHKPTCIIGFDEIDSVEFQRYGGAQVGVFSWLLELYSCSGEMILNARLTTKGFSSSWTLHLRNSVPRFSFFRVAPEIREDFYMQNIMLCFIFQPPLELRVGQSRQPNGW